jgi:hypothetical protein
MLLVSAVRRDDTGRSLNARIGAFTSWARTSDRSARMKPARDRFLEKFERQVDPEGILPEKERRQRALTARKAYMLQLARRSAIARRIKTGMEMGESDEETIRRRREYAEAQEAGREVSEEEIEEVPEEDMEAFRQMMVRARRTKTPGGRPADRKDDS